MKRVRLVLAGSGSGVGKTSISAGLMAAFRRRGLTVQPFKVGPDYIDPAFHSFVTGRQSRNLDAWLLEEDILRELFLRNAPADGLSVVEGVMGLFDGQAESGLGSSAHVAQIIAAPTVLIINGAGISRSAAALVQGYDRFLPSFRLAGVIINRLSGPAHYDLLRKYIEDEAGVPCFGYLPKKPGFSLESRHLGLVPSGEVADLSQKLAALADAAEESLDLDGLLKLAEAAPELPAPSAALGLSGPGRVRLGLARDQAFNFYYQDNLDLLSELGAEIVPFSPLNDPALPLDLDGLYLGGGFPEVFADHLEANLSLRSEILAALEEGLPAYAECGGLMYLNRSLTDLEGREHRMVGFFPGRAVMTPRLQNFGYVELSFQQETVLGPAGTRIKGHEFHHSRLEDLEAPYVAEVRKNALKAWPGALRRKNVLAAYPHLHFWANPQTAVSFINQCHQYRQRRNSHESRPDAAPVG